MVQIKQLESFSQILLIQNDFFVYWCCLPFPKIYEAIVIRVNRSKKIWGFFVTSNFIIDLLKFNCWDKTITIQVKKGKSFSRKCLFFFRQQMWCDHRDCSMFQLFLVLHIQRKIFLSEYFQNLHYNLAHLSRLFLYHLYWSRQVLSSKSINLLTLVTRWFSFWSLYSITTSINFWPHGCVFSTTLAEITNLTTKFYHVFLYHPFPWRAVSQPT